MSMLRWTKFSATLAAALFNNWLLGIIFNYHLFAAGGSVSEFSASGQAYAWLFRSLDVAAGLFMMVTAALIFRQRNAHHYWSWIAVGLFILGIANCADAALRLPCAGSVDLSCNAPIHISLRRISLPDHVLSSVIIGIMFLILPAVSFYNARLEGRRQFKRVSLISLLITVMFLVFLFIEALTRSSGIDKIAGFSEELQMLVFGWWLVELVPSAKRAEKVIASKSSRSGPSPSAELAEPAKR